MKSSVLAHRSEHRPSPARSVLPHSELQCQGGPLTLPSQELTHALGRQPSESKDSLVLGVRQREGYKGRKEGKEKGGI